MLATCWAAGGWLGRPPVENAALQLLRWHLSFFLWARPQFKIHICAFFTFDQRSLLLISACWWHFFLDQPIILNQRKWLAVPQWNPHSCVFTWHLKMQPQETEDGDNDTITKARFSQLVKTQLPHILDVSHTNVSLYVHVYVFLLFGKQCTFKCIKHNHKVITFTKCLYFIMWNYCYAHIHNTIIHHIKHVSFLQDVCAKKLVDALDGDKDGVISLEEYFVLISSLCLTLNAIVNKSMSWRKNNSSLCGLPKQMFNSIKIQILLIQSCYLIMFYE